MSLINRLLTSLEARKNSAAGSPNWKALNELKPVVEKVWVPGFQRWAYLGFLASVISGAVATIMYLDKLAEQADNLPPIAQSSKPKSFPPGQIVRDSYHDALQQPPVLLAQNTATPTSTPVKAPSIPPSTKQTSPPITLVETKPITQTPIKSTPKPATAAAPAVVATTQKIEPVAQEKTPVLAETKTSLPVKTFITERAVSSTSTAKSVTAKPVPVQVAKAASEKSKQATPAPAVKAQERAKVEEGVRNLEKADNDVVVIKEKAEDLPQARKTEVASEGVKQQNDVSTNVVATAPASVEKTESEKPSRVTRKDLALTSDQQALVGYEQGVSYLGNGRIAEAEQRFRDSLTKNEKHRNARIALAGLLVDSGRRMEASKILDDGLRLEPGYLPYVVSQARLLAENGAMHEALNLLVQHFNNELTEPDYLAFMANLYQTTGNNEQAIIYYQKALSHAPYQGKTWLGLAIAQEAQKNWVEAQIAYNRALGDNTLDAQLISFSQKRLAFVRQNVPFASN